MGQVSRQLFYTSVTDKLSAAMDDNQIQQKGLGKDILLGTVLATTAPDLISRPVSALTSRLITDSNRGADLISKVSKDLPVHVFDGIPGKVIDVFKGGGGYSPDAKMIALSASRAKEPAVIAHEYGHYLDSLEHADRMKNGVRMATVAAPSIAVLGTMYALRQKDEKKRRNALIGTSVLSAGAALPNLYSEYKASELGLEVLKQHYPDIRLGRSRARLAAALATYGLGAAGTAAIPWVVAKLRDRRRLKEQQQLG